MLKPIFAGELMTCALCGKEETSDPQAESQWRCLELDGVRFYACPDEFPQDPGSRAEFGAAYTRLFSKILLDRAEAAGADTDDLRQKFDEMDAAWKRRREILRRPAGKRRLLRAKRGGRDE